MAVLWCPRQIYIVVQQHIMFVACRRYNASYHCASLGGVLADLSNDELREAAMELYNRSEVRQELDVAGGVWIGLHANQWRPVVASLYDGMYL